MARTYNITKEQLEELYHAKGLSLRKVAIILSTSADTILRYMGKFNIKTRGLSKSHASQIPWNKGINTGIVPKSVFKKNHIPWNKWLTKKDNNKIKSYHSFSKGNTPWNKGKNKSNCDIYKNMSKERSGSNHWMWKGGITSIRNRIYASSEYKIWRTSVFKRDGYTCQSCGRTGKYLEAHHLYRFSDYVNKRFDVDNGVTLCKTCHRNLGSKHTTPKNHKEKIYVTRK